VLLLLIFFAKKKRRSQSRAMAWGRPRMEEGWCEMYLNGAGEVVVEPAACITSMERKN
jgi:hypothetical protein